MNEISGWVEIMTSSLKAFGEQFMKALPSVIGAVIVLLLGWLIAKLIGFTVTRVLKFIHFDILAEKAQIQKNLEKANVKAAPSKLLGKFVYWLIILFAIITAADILGWSSFSAEISKIIGFLPNLIVGIFFFMIGIYIAGFVRDLITGASESIGVKSGKLVGNFVFYFLFVVVTLTALQQTGINTDIITSNLLIILGTILAAAAISYGLASREILTNILANYYTRNQYKKNMVVEIDGIKGEIIENSTIGLTIKINENEKMTIPSKELIQKKIKIFN